MTSTRGYRISRETVQGAMLHPKVRVALAGRRDRVKARAAAILASENIEGELTAQDGTRPKGRPFSRVSLDNTDQEWGTSKTARRRVLGRSR